MRKLEAYFIDKNGKKIYNPNIEFHETLATQILDNNPELKKEFEDSKIDSTALFLITKGYLHITQDLNAEYMSIMYSCLSMNEITKEILGEFKSRGYSLYDIIRNDLSEAQLNNIKELLKEGKSREEIMKMVVYDMIKENNTKETISRD